jgi:mannitol/fructose-specific phosphotransferase system IIA component
MPLGLQRTLRLAWLGNGVALPHGAKEYACGDVTTNTVEGYFAIFKRGTRGNYSTVLKGTCIAT